LPRRTENSLEHSLQWLRVLSFTPVRAKAPASQQSAHCRLGEPCCTEDAERTHRARGPSTTAQGHEKSRRSHQPQLERHARRRHHHHCRRRHHPYHHQRRLAGSASSSGGSPSPTTRCMGHTACNPPCFCPKPRQEASPRGRSTGWARIQSTGRAPHNHSNINTGMRKKPVSRGGPRILLHYN
jgi:hypothetical protein